MPIKHMAFKAGTEFKVNWSESQTEISIEKKDDRIVLNPEGASPTSRILGAAESDDKEKRFEENEKQEAHN